MKRKHRSLRWRGGAIFTLGFMCGCASSGRPARLVPITEGWARNSVNATIFRTNSVTSHGKLQAAAFYDGEGRVVLAKRRLPSGDWEIRRTPYKGNVRDAHNGISIAFDGNGVLHMAWNHHNNPLHYRRGVEPEALEMSDLLPMTGRGEERVTYPEFFNLPDGGLLFMYRDGSSGNGNLMLNRYDLASRKWSVVRHNLIDGQGERNAYTNQIAVDGRGVWHLSWCWRESGDVATNHDVCYAKSPDGGRTWMKSTGEAYELPITADTAEIAWQVPQKSELINQTSMTVDGKGRPWIATYWRPPGTQTPQYHVVFHDGRRWAVRQVGERRTPFTLSGGGTKRIPISRPKVLIDSRRRVFVLFRDTERGNRVSVATLTNSAANEWTVRDLTTDSVGLWEPTYDPVLWQKKNQLHLFVQRVGQGDGERLEDLPPQMAYILEWAP